MDQDLMGKIWSHEIEDHFVHLRKIKSNNYFVHATVHSFIVHTCYQTAIKAKSEVQQFRTGHSEKFRS